MNLKKKFALSSLLMVSLSVSVNAADIEEGESLYQDDCVACHDSSVFTRPAEERKVNDLEALKKQVHRCVMMTELGWFEEDEENVVEYLNTNYYKFKKVE